MINQKEVGVQVAARTPVCANNSLWNNQRLDSLSDQPSKPQIRCKRLNGRSDVFQYEVNVQGCWIASNYQFAQWVVANQEWLNRKQKCGVNSCQTQPKRLTGFTGTGAELSCMSLDSKKQETASSSSELVTRMSALSPLNCSAKSSRGSYER